MIRFENITESNVHSGGDMGVVLNKRWILNRTLLTTFISPVPFSLASSSSSNLKLRGITIGGCAILLSSSFKIDVDNDKPVRSQVLLECRCSTKSLPLLLRMSIALCLSLSNCATAAAIITSSLRHHLIDDHPAGSTAETAAAEAQMR